MKPVISLFLVAAAVAGCSGQNANGADGNDSSNALTAGNEPSCEAAVFGSGEGTCFADAGVGGAEDAGPPDIGSLDAGPPGASTEDAGPPGVESLDAGI